MATVTGGFLGLSNLPGYLKANFVLLAHPEFIPSILTENNFEEVQLDIKFKHFSKIEQKRKEALMRDQLVSSDADFVPGKISADELSFDCKLRLKGDLSDHWENQKVSLRIRLKDGGTLFGMSSFSLQRPVTRGNTSQFLFLESLRRENLLAVRYKFINLTMNGKSMGVYAMEEHFSKELVESQRRRDGVMVSFDEYRYWKNLDAPLTNFQLASAYQSAEINLRNNKRIVESPLLLKQKVIALNLLRSFQEKKLQGDEVFSPDKVGRFLAICRLWNAEHAFLLHNINFYYDPITSRLEPIGFDGMPLSYVTSPYCYFSAGEVPDNWVNHALRSPQIAKSYIKHLESFTRQSYIEELKDDLALEELSLRRTLYKNLFWESTADIWKSDGTLINYNPWNNLAERVRSIRRELEENVPAMTYARPALDKSSDLDVVVRNPLTQPIEIIGFENSNRKWIAKEIIRLPNVFELDPTRKNIVMPLQRFGHSTFEGDHIFRITDYFDKNSTQEQIKPVKSLHLITRILGMDDRIIRLPIPVDSSRFKPEKLPFIKHSGNIISKHSFLHENGDSIYVAPGEHEVTEDLIIPAHRVLKIPAGTILRFHKEAIMVCKSPILAIGSEKKPIILTALGSKWPGILIANANERSEFRHIQISKTGGIGEDLNPGGIDRSGWTLTGGITFYHSPVDLSHCKISDSFSEDALNIIACDFTLNDSFFANASSDAFDGDFVKGKISNCSFEQIGGDAIDLSGSNVAINGVRVLGTADKALSAGEDTRVTISDCRFEEIGFGIAAKDLSEVRVHDVKIHKARICALAAYQKKNIFGPAKITGKGLQITATEKTHLIQKGSLCEIDGRKFQQTDLDVDSLYWEKGPQK